MGNVTGVHDADALRREAAALSNAALIERVRRAAQLFEQTLRSLSDADTEGQHEARQRANVGVSVAREVLHVALTGELPDEQGMEIAGELGLAADQYSQAIESCIAHIEAADADAFLDVTWRHPVLGELNWREWFLFLAYDAAQGARPATGQSS